MSYYTIKQVNPAEIYIGLTYPRDVARQKARLLDEGQIEPISVKQDDGFYKLDENNPDYFIYSDAIIQAARDLEWPTLLVSVKVLN